MSETIRFRREGICYEANLTLEAVLSDVDRSELLNSCNSRLPTPDSRLPAPGS